MSGNRCHCGRYAAWSCDWPVPEVSSGVCGKPVCDACRRRVGAKDICPFHRGDIPMTQAEMDKAGADAAAEAARILGVTR